MPLFDFLCKTCGNTSEILVTMPDQKIYCRICCGTNLVKRLSAPAAYNGSFRSCSPNQGDSGCCGSTQGMAHDCAGPGSCCGKMKNL